MKYGKYDLNQSPQGIANDLLNRISQRISGHGLYVEFGVEIHSLVEDLVIQFKGLQDLSENNSEEFNFDPEFVENIRRTATKSFKQRQQESDDLGEAADALSNLEF